MKWANILVGEPSGRSFFKLSLLMLPAAAFPLALTTKLLAALVLLPVWAVRVVLETIEVPAIDGETRSSRKTVIKVHFSIVPPKTGEISRARNVSLWI